MTSLFKAYGKVDDLDHASLEARRKTRRRLTIIGVSSLLLIVIIVGAVLGTKHGSDPSSNTAAPDSKSFATSIKALCDATLYPGSCLASLAPMANSSGLDPIKLFHLSVQVAMDELAKASRQFGDIGVKGVIDKMSLAALSDCEGLIALAVDHLKECVSSTDLLSSAAVDDLKTWLSGATTNLDTCMEGFSNATTELKTMVLEATKNSTELTSNSLAIVTKIYDFMGSVKLRRRLMSYSDDDDMPSWLSPKDRRLLQSWDPSKNANVVVAKDGSGKYKTIKAAIGAVPEESNKRFVIYVKKGVYYENVKIDEKKWNVMIIGDGMGTTIVSGSLNVVDGTPTYSTATFAVIGKGFMARDIGFRNTAGPVKQQAVALMSDSDQSVFYRCGFDAYQDTLYAHSMRQFYRECNIYGTVDFIFGNAAAVLQSCNILPRKPIPGQQDTITAQGRVDPNQNTGISIHNCTIRPYGDLRSVKVYLGRPWKPYSRTVYMRSTFSSVIDPAGWLPWVRNMAPDTIFYSEFQNFGPGASTRNRVKWKGLRTMSLNQANGFTVGSFIGGKPWIPKAGVPYQSGL